MNGRARGSGRENLEQTPYECRARHGDPSRDTKIMTQAKNKIWMLPLHHPCAP